MKKYWSGIIICVILVVTAIAVVFIFRNNSQQTLTQKEAEKYAVYTLELPEGSGTTVEKAVRMCEPASSDVYGDITYTLYTSSELGNYLYDCAASPSISVNSYGTLFISYTTSNGLDITLQYDGNVLTYRGIFSSSTNNYIEQSFGVTLMNRNFRSGTKLFSSRDEAEAEVAKGGAEITGGGYDNKGAWYWEVSYS